MALMNKFCIDHHQEIFCIPASIQAKLNTAEEKEKENKAASPVRNTRKLEDTEATPIKHKKIIELAGGEGDTLRKRAKVDSPARAHSKLQQQQPSSPARSPSKRGLRSETKYREADSAAIYGL